MLCKIRFFNLLIIIDVLFNQKNIIFKNTKTYSIFSAGAAKAKAAESPTKSQLKITDLKDFNKLTSKKGEMSQSSSNNSLSKKDISW